MSTKRQSKGKANGVSRKKSKIVEDDPPTLSEEEDDDDDNRKSEDEERDEDELAEENESLVSVHVYLPLPEWPSPTHFGHIFLLVFNSRLKTVPLPLIVLSEFASSRNCLCDFRFCSITSTLPQIGWPSYIRVQSVPLPVVQPFNVYSVYYSILWTLVSASPCHYAHT